jgi:hypothetical protein
MEQERKASSLFQANILNCKLIYGIVNEFNGIVNEFNGIVNEFNGIVN